jgi:hypothetical protein
MTYDNLHIASHTELGDLLVCEGIIRHYAACSAFVTFDTTYPKEARELFSDLKNVRPIEREKDYSKRHPAPAGVDRVIWLGLCCDEREAYGRFLPNSKVCTFDHIRWDREFYRQAGVPFTERWTKSKLPSPSKYPIPCKTQAILVHDEEQHRIEFPFDEEPVRIAPVEGHSAFIWMCAMQRARQIHCIDSSMANLVESMWANGYLNLGTELFFHVDARPTVPATLLAPWRTVL